jgi:hypothetical protein
MQFCCIRFTPSPHASERMPSRQRRARFSAVESEDLLAYAGSILSVG